LTSDPDHVLDIAAPRRVAVSETRTLLSVEGVSRSFGPIVALENVSLTVGRGEFVTLLGPSGCGKTTLLRIVAGFESVDGGRVLIDGENLLAQPPERRPVNLVFQRYALFPHLTVWENVAFGLRVGGVKPSEVDRRVEEALASVRLSGFGGRSIDALSGGQQQRVAVARAVINQPALLLLDEPLGALDLKLRKEMQSELRSLQRQLDTAFLYVTHDQEEALAMSDTVVVMREGKVEQIGSPIDLYQRPRSRFVATFVGESNLLAGRNDGGRLELEGLGTVPSPPGPLGTVFLSVRPEDLRLGPGGDSELVGTLADVVFLGATTRYVVRLSDGTLLDVDETRASQADAELGQPVTISWSSTHAVVVPQA
jgi:ABC-type Fe3+/spermidine/putrescine transport system ATPase subunit